MAACLGAWMRQQVLGFVSASDQMGDICRSPNPWKNIADLERRETGKPGLLGLRTMGLERPREGCCEFGSVLFVGVVWSLEVALSPQRAQRVGNGCFSTISKEQLPPSHEADTALHSRRLVINSKQTGGVEDGR